MKSRVRKRLSRRSKFNLEGEWMKSSVRKDEAEDQNLIGERKNEQNQVFVKTK